jgi:bZIP transcription factor
MTVTGTEALSNAVAATVTEYLTFKTTTNVRDGSITCVQTSATLPSSSVDDNDMKHGFPNAKSNIIESDNISRSDDYRKHHPMTDAITSDTCSFTDEDESDNNRLSRCRERNREHARKTRLRKKAHILSLQNKVKILSEEHSKLKQRIDECSIASILIGLGTSSTISNDILPIDSDRTISLMDEDQNARVALLTEGSKKCRRLLVDSVFRDTNGRSESFDSKESTMDGIPGKRHVSWKTGIFHEPNGQQRRLTEAELDALR